MSRLFLLAMTALMLQGAHVLAQTQADSLTLTNSTILEGWLTTDSALTALVNLGLQNKIPLGIVIEGVSLCTHPVTSNKPEITAADLGRQIEVLVPGYTGEIRDGMLFIHPKAMASSTLGLLHLVVPRFASAPTTVQQLGVGLWMYIRAILVPGEGAAFVGGWQRDAELLPSIEVSNATVENILDLIITKKSGGLWTLHEVPEDWRTNPKKRPYELLSYSGSPREAKSISCSR